MKRRTFLLAGGATAVVLAGGVAARKATLPQADIAGLLAELEVMGGRQLGTTSGWSAYKVLSHLSQSIEFSMTGYPQMKSAVFRHTAGAAAFLAFSVAGAMKHPLDEPIPGAQVIADEGDVPSALLRLKTALQDFAAYEGKLAPHFAYGELSKDEYAHAHVMHVRDHFRLFSDQSLGAGA